MNVKYIDEFKSISTIDLIFFFFMILNDAKYSMLKYLECCLVHRYLISFSKNKVD